MIKAISEAVSAMFMMEGLEEVGTEAVYRAWGHGAMELVTELAHYAYLAEELSTAGVRVLNDFPGVYDYEVSNPFGKWFAQSVVDKGYIPLQGECWAKLQELALKFFSQGTEDQSTLKRLEAALKQVMEITEYEA